MTDYPDYATPQAHATAISTTGVPLLTAATGLLTQSFNPAAGATQSSGNLTVSQIGYELVITSSFSVAPTTPFVVVQLEWFIVGVGTRVATDTFVCPASTTPGAFTTYVTGPTKGTGLTMHVTNLDGLQVNLTAVTVLENSRVYDRDRMRWDNGLNAGLTVAGWTLPVLPNDESVLGMESAASVPASGNISWLCAPHNGLVNFGFDLGGGTLPNIHAAVQAVPSSRYVTNNPIYGSTTMVPNFQVACPRAPIRLLLSNTATTPITVTWSAVRAD